MRTSSSSAAANPDDSKATARARGHRLTLTARVPYNKRTSQIHRFSDRSILAAAADAAATANTTVCTHVHVAELSDGAGMHAGPINLAPSPSASDALRSASTCRHKHPSAAAQLKRERARDGCKPERAQPKPSTKQWP